MIRIICLSDAFNFEICLYFLKKPETITAAEVQSCLFVQIREIFYSSVIKKWPIETPSKGTVDQRNCRFGFFHNEDVAAIGSRCGKSLFDAVDAQ